MASVGARRAKDVCGLHGLRCPAVRVDSWELEIVKHKRSVGCAPGMQREAYIHRLGVFGRVYIK